MLLRPAECPDPPEQEAVVGWGAVQAAPQLVGRTASWQGLQAGPLPCTCFLRKMVFSPKTLLFEGNVGFVGVFTALVMEELRCCGSCSTVTL